MPRHRKNRRSQRKREAAQRTKPTKPAKPAAPRSSYRPPALMKRSARLMGLVGPIHEVKIQATPDVEFGRCHTTAISFCDKNPDWKHLCCWNILEEPNPELTHGNGYPFWAQWHSIVQGPDGTLLDVSPTTGDIAMYAGPHKRQTRRVVLETQITGSQYIAWLEALQTNLRHNVSINHRFVDFDTRTIMEWQQGGASMLMIGLERFNKFCQAKDPSEAAKAIYMDSKKLN